MSKFNHFKPRTRIKKILAFYLSRGVNKESVNKVNRNILKSNK